MICTSWDDDDLHNQMWMMHFVNAVAWSWNGSKPSLEGVPGIISLIHIMDHRAYE